MKLAYTLVTDVHFQINVATEGDLLIHDTVMNEVRVYRDGEHVFTQSVRDEDVVALYDAGLVNTSGDSEPGAYVPPMDLNHILHYSAEHTLPANSYPVVEDTLPLSEVDPQFQVYAVTLEFVSGTPEGAVFVAGFSMNSGKIQVALNTQSMNTPVTVKVHYTYKVYGQLT